MDLILSLTTLVLIAAGLAMQIMTRRAWQTAIAAVEDRIDRLEERASAAEKITEVSTAMSSAMNHATVSRVRDTEIALAELKAREEARRAEPSASDLAKTIGLLGAKSSGNAAFIVDNTKPVLQPNGPRRPRPTKPEGK